MVCLPPVRVPLPTPVGLLLTPKPTETEVPATLAIIFVRVPAMRHAPGPGVTPGPTAASLKVIHGATPPPGRSIGGHGFAPLTSFAAPVPEIPTGAG